VGSEVFQQIERAGRKRILGFHICDWLVPTQHLLLDRGMMGDGVIDIRAARQAVEALGYQGRMKWRFSPNMTGGNVTRIRCSLPAKRVI
jgi:sugar phosphate isomerase/epimerase